MTSKNILMTGTTFRVPDKRATPRLTLFPMSLNCVKAMACLRFSTLDDTEFNLINYPEDNQTLDYARLNPNMTIPVLEIDDLILTDSREIQKYLTQHHPSKGDAALIQNNKLPDMDAFIDKVCQWDEYLFSYRTMPRALGEGLHQIRLVAQAQALAQAQDEGVLDEVLRNGQTIRQAYVKKMAHTRALIDVGTGPETPQLAKRIEQNHEMLQDIFQAASCLLQHSDGPFLLGPHLTSADAYFVPVVERVGTGDARLLNSFFAKYPETRQWWTVFQQQPEADVVTQYGKAWLLPRMLFSSKPFKIMGSIMGLYVPGKLPEDIEADVQAELEKLENEYLME